MADPKILPDNEESSSSSGADEEKMKRLWRSASWSSSHSAPPSPGRTPPVDKSGTSFPLTPRNSGRARPTLPPLQTSSRNGSEEGSSWAPLTPRREINRMKNGLEIKLDLAAVQRCRDSSEPTEMQMKRDKFAYYEKECSRVAEHIYLGSDAVARNRDTLLANKITHVLNCVGFICKEYFRDDFKYNTLWLQDSPSEDITSILYDVFDYFEEVRELGGRVFVHCCQGVSRSTALVIAYLMWREGRSFEDAFQDVKAARGITNPNMGFACQLLQAQKRVHASPASPNSLLRMYRMAPHSPYDALHLVPKTINNPGSGALDSRGAFVVHIPSTIFVWTGRSCEQGMERLAKAAAGQVVRYERAQAPIVCIQEGSEPPEFWEAFSKGVSGASSNSGAPLSSKVKRVEAYDLDFDLYHRALQGVVPPSGAVITHVPARDSGWSRLRKKFFSGSVREKVPAEENNSGSSSKSKQSEVFKGVGDKLLSPNSSGASTPSSSSPPISNCPSPSCSFSHSRSPSPSSSYSWSPASSEESSVSSRYIRFPSLLTPVKGPSGGSLAKRRGGASPSLFLGSVADEAPPTPRFGKSFGFKSGSGEGSCSASATPSPGSDPGSSLMDIDTLKPGGAPVKDERRIYKWPGMERLEFFSGREELSSSSVYLLLNSGDVFVWVGSEARDENWEQVCSSFLQCLGHHSDKPPHVIKEGEEAHEFWELFCSE